MAKTIKFVRTYDAPIAVVWKALTDPAAMSEWLMPCDINPVVGHKFQFKTKPAPGFDGVVHCEVLEVLENELLSFSWSGGSLKNTTVTFKLSEVDGKSKLELEHRGFEGFLNNLIVKRILGSGWKKILSKELPQHLFK